MNRITPSGNRQVRIYISSNFREMQKERDILVKRVFPQLRRLCEMRAVILTEVDLRWGITEEEVAEGKAVPVCFDEISRCRPFFIGLLGERYGWVPDTIPQELIEGQPWLKEHLGKTGKSVTELEILHDVLNNPEMAEHAFFYFRDAAYIKSIPPEKQKDFTAEDTTGAEKLLRLKQRIRVAASEGRCSLRENFRTPEELGEWVLQDLREKIDPQQALNMNGVESARHLAFARRQVRTYLPRQGHFEQLDAALLIHRKPLLVTGEVGIGKSALLANWSLQRQESHPIEIILLHFAGSVRDSANDSRAMRRIMHELRRLCYLSMDVPEADDEIRRHFTDFLSAASEMERIILVIDGLEAFGSSDEPCSLDWLPIILQTTAKSSRPRLLQQSRKHYEIADGRSSGCPA